MKVLDAIAARRSHKRLIEPAPSREQLETMFVAASQAPDHKQLTPWQFVVLDGGRKDAFASVLAEGLQIRDPEATQGQLDKERSKPRRAPLIVVAIARRLPTTLPFEELYAATCAAVQNLLLAATSMGFGTIWRSGASIHDEHVKSWLDLTYGDEIVGFIYIGTPDPSLELEERAEPDLRETVVWS